MPKTARTSPLTKPVVILVLVAATVVAYFLFQTYNSSIESTDPEQSVLIHIPEGSNFDQIVDSLDRAGLLGDRRSFRILAKLRGADGELHSGTYRFYYGTSNADLLDALRSGESTVRVKVTFPEGVTIRRIASIAARRAGIDSARLHQLATDREFLATIGLTAETAEGYLMPDTYFINWGSDPEVLLREMSALFRKYYDDERKRKASELGLTAYEAIILASLVEGEAKTDEDRPIVAGLYLNRLERGMRLQADPTIQYVLEDGPRRLLYEDLEMDSPYNTYRYAGLPPTPINNPGRASIDAALNPTESDYIYMVARADGTGSHEFSTNLGDHQRAVNRYRQRVRSQRDGE